MRVAIRTLLTVVCVWSSVAGAATSAEIEALSRKTTISRENVLLVSTQGANIRQLVGLDENGDERLARGLTIDVPQKDALPLVEKLQKTIGKEHVVFVSEQNFGIKNALDQVSVLKSKDQFDALRVMSTNAWNYDMSPKDVLKKIKEWDRRYGLIVVGAGQDWMHAKFKRTPHPMLSFAKEVFKFCPDIVEQGTGTVDKLASEMQSANSLYLWWD